MSEVSKCNQGEIKEVREGMRFKGVRKSGMEKSSWVEIEALM